MKNIFRTLSIVLLAGSMMMVGCKKDENNNGGNTGGQTTKYTITVTANVDSMGTVTGGGQYEANATATLTATANAGYQFVKWTDGNTNNPRTVTVTANATYTAEFAMKQGVDVTFGSTSWHAGFTLGMMANNAILISAAQNSDASGYPQIYFTNFWDNGTPTVGTYSGGTTLEVQGENVSINFSNTNLEYFESDYIEFTSRNAGDWWSKSVTANITTLDAESMLTSMVINATMAHATDLFNEQGYMISVDLDDCESRTITVEVNNQTLTQYSGGGRSPKNNFTLKLKK